MKNYFHKLLHHGQKAHKTNKKTKKRILKFLMKVLYNTDIPFEADICETVWFCHSGFGTVINRNAKIGNNVIIQHGVTIGELEDNGDAPIIADNVYIGARAILLGGICIGESAKIGAGAVVIKDVPPGATVVGNPMRIIKNSNED